MFISPFDDYAVMAANGGTVAMEVIEDAPAARAFILPVGGGGLPAGFAFARSSTTLNHYRLPARIVAGAAMSLDAGHAITKLPAVETMAGRSGRRNRRAHVRRARRRCVDRVALVSEDEILEAVRWMVAHHQYLIEPTAAVTVAACLAGRVGKIDEARGGDHFRTQHERGRGEEDSVRC